METVRNIFSVYIKVDDSGRITAVNSDAFLTTFENWVKIAEGYGDKYHHAQGNYLPKSLIDERGIFNFKFVDGEIVERTMEELEADYIALKEKYSKEDRIAQLEEAFNLLLEGATE